MSEQTNVFGILSKVDVRKKIKEKNGLKYLSWASAWSEVKKVYPDATYRVIPQIMDEAGNTRFWHDDGKTGWVEVGVTINGVEQVEQLAIMDFKNKSIPAADITSVDANKSAKRCLVKACALHGLAIHIFEGEECPEEVKRVFELIDEIKELAKKKCAISDDVKAKVMSLCIEAEKQACPDVPEDEITGNYKNINDAQILENLKRKIMAVRK